ncbi:MAG: alkaline shock response membrane anchor protein AmaP [Verrucomicrobia bacterium]|nr:MAG: alkaline shock response membrane anchor protein AmaP [Verrucomicrobiota bacterium]
MKTLHRAVGLVLFLLISLAAAFFVYAAISSSLWNETFQILGDNKWPSVATGLLVFLLVLFYSYTGSHRAEYERYISFEGEGGSVRISRHAIRDFLAGIAVEFSTVEKLDPEFTMQRENMDVDLHVTVRPGCHIPELSRMLQERVRTTMRVSLGITQIGKVDVLVQEIAGAAERTPRRDEADNGWEGDLHG